MGAKRVRKARREDGKLREVKAESQAGLQAKRVSVMRPEPRSAWPAPKTDFDVSPAARRECLHNTAYDQDGPYVEWIPDPDAENYPVALEQGLFDILRLFDV